MKDVFQKPANSDEKARRTGDALPCQARKCGQRNAQQCVAVEVGVNRSMVRRWARKQEAVYTAAGQQEAKELLGVAARYNKNKTILRMGQFATSRAELARRLRVEAKQRRQRKLRESLRGVQKKGRDIAIDFLSKRKRKREGGRVERSSS